MNKVQEFNHECEVRINNQKTNVDLQNASKAFMNESIAVGYSYNFKWLGRPIIQYPQDIMALQEIIWEIKPDLIIETGIAHGGSLIFSASILELIGNGEVLGIDIDIRDHNKKEIENHPLYKRITMVQGSSISDETLEIVKSLVSNKKTVMVCLDSNHTHEHVLAELKLYAPFVTINSYLCVFDGIVENIPVEKSPAIRPWGIGNNPYTAVQEFIKSNADFIIDEQIDNKILLSVAPKGYLKRIK